MPMGNAMASKQLMSTYAEILKSRSVIAPVIEQTEEADSDGKYMRYEDYIKNRIVTNPFKDTEILKVTVNANTPEGAQKANDLIVNGFLPAVDQSGTGRTENYPRLYRRAGRSL